MSKDHFSNGQAVILIKMFFEYAVYGGTQR
jgi:hypothetical protein